MNSVAFFLRNKLNENRFSDAVLASLSLASVDAALLCSGFFQEDPSYSVSANKFSTIKRCKNRLDLTTVGYYKGGKASYAAFAAGIAAHCCASCVSHTQLRLPGDKWHAKIFIGKSRGDPVVAAIGSSNLTRRAFDTLKNFNYECDVLFWDETHAEINAAMSGVIGETRDESMSEVVAKVDETHPVNHIPIREKLRDLEHKIRSRAVAIGS